MWDGHAVASQPIVGDRTLCDALPLVSASAPHALTAADAPDRGSVDASLHSAASAVTIPFSQLLQGISLNTGFLVPGTGENVMSPFLRLSIVVCCASSGSLAARTATAQPPDTPAPAALQEIVAPAESVPTTPPLALPEPGPPAPQLPEIPAAVVPPPANFSVESEAVAAVCEKIEQALNATAEVDFNETPLSEVVSYLRETYQIPIIIDKRALDDVGMGSDTPVTISLHGISLRSLLKLMLKELDLTYVVHDQVLKITTPEEAEKELVGPCVSGRGPGRCRSASRWWSTSRKATTRRSSD